MDRLRQGAEPATRRRDCRADEGCRLPNAADRVAVELMSDSSRKLALLLVFSVVFIDLLGFGLLLPLLPVYAKQLTAGYSAAKAGWILAALMSCFSMMQFLFAPLWGRISDWVGRRPVLLISLAGSTLFYAMFAVATLQHSLTWMFVARIGAGIAGTFSSGQATESQSSASISAAMAFRSSISGFDAAQRSKPSRITSPGLHPASSSNFTASRSFPEPKPASG